MPNTARMNWPYPDENADPWFDAIESYFNAADTSGYAGRENDQAVLMGGGSISFNGTSGVVLWTDDIEIISAYTGFKWTIPAGQVTLDDGQLAYTTLTRAISNNLNVSLVVASQVPTNDNTLIFAIRRGTHVYFRNGAAVEQGTSITPISGSAGSLSNHGADHLSGGVDEIDGDQLDVDFVPSNYTRDVTPAEVTSVEHLTAHLKGMDLAIGAAQAVSTNLTNTTGSAQTQGAPVYSNGDGTFGLAVATSSTTARVIGFVDDASIANSAVGQILIAGALTVPPAHQSGGAWSAGERIYLATTAGNLTNQLPVAPNFEVPVGVVQNTPAGGDAIVLINLDPILELQATNSDQGIDNEIQTTDATPTVVHTFITTVDSRLTTFNLQFIASNADGTEGAFWDIRYVFRRDAGSTITLDHEDVLSTYQDDVDWDFDFNISGANIEVRVIGDPTDTIHWRVVGEARTND